MKKNKLNETETKQELDLTRLPKHIGIIIDGNGRWAKQRGLTRSMGHKAGFENVKKIFKAVYALGIKHLTIYCFSTENWNRPKEEVDYLMDTFRKMLKSNYFADLNFNPKLNVCGDPTRFAPDIQELIALRMEETKNNTDITLNLCMNYGGRSEIVYAVNAAIKDGVKEFDINTLNNYLYTKGQPDPDLIIRTSGEIRLSNFLLWQCAYAEFSFPKIYWPAFTEEDLKNCLINYQNRDRRFGSIKS